MQFGLCRNPACPLSASGERVERYPGAGEYCPGCGEPLVAIAPPPPEVELGPEVYEKFHSRMSEALFPATQSRRRQWILLLSIAVVFGTILVIALVRAMPVGSSAVGQLQVCGSSMTQRLAVDVVHAYAASRQLSTSHFVVAPAGACGVRFALTASAERDAVVAHDGVVVVVNPANRLGGIEEAELSRILRGVETTWPANSGVGGPIVPLVPAEGTDEARALTTLLHGAKLGSNVRRVASSADVVRAVAAANGRQTIGIVAFSAAAPAKVLALAGRPIPSAVSIADHRYPLAFDVSVIDESRQHDGIASALAGYARSDDAQSVVVRNGFIAKKGF